ncbi:YbaY family lipoprotein [Lutimaribacter marinistellae]|uniref:YbaY family lipoprotein n=1 Tax=Lutimaribacter marinistellae TaxID=1820329 RepID=A0ABV7TIK5_9RHOB
MKRMILAGAMMMAAAGGAMAGTVEGTASYRERIAVLPGSVLEVQLLDVSRADAKADVLSSRRYALKGVPAGFELPYDDALIDERMRYVLRATISREGRLMFTTDRAYPVLTQGAGNSADLMLVKVSSPAPITLPGTAWIMEEMGDAELLEDRLPEITFGEGGEFAGTGGCNRMRGMAEIGDGTLAFPDAIAATMMACAEEVEAQERAFMDRLALVEGYEVTTGALVLTDGAGEALMRFRPMN